MKYKLKMDPRAGAWSGSREMVAYARSLCADVEFSPEDAGRCDPEFLYVVLGEAIKAGATTLNIPDTVGYTTPDEFGALIAGIMKNTPGHRERASSRCTATMTWAWPPPTRWPGMQAGRAPGRSDHQRHRRARGQHLAGRSGDGAADPPPGLSAWRPASTPPRSRASASWSAITPASSCSRTRPSSARMPSPTRRASIRMACSRTNQTYEIMRPEIGRRRRRPSWCWASTPGGTRSRRAWPSWAMRLDEAELDKAFERFKELADKKKIITDADLEALVADEFYQPRELSTRWTACRWPAARWACPPPPSACAARTADRTSQAAIGTGPVDAAYKAIDAHRQGARARCWSSSSTPSPKASTRSAK